MRQLSLGGMHLCRKGFVHSGVSQVGSVTVLHYGLCGRRVHITLTPERLHARVFMNKVEMVAKMFGTRRRGSEKSNVMRHL